MATNTTPIPRKPLSLVQRKLLNYHWYEDSKTISEWLDFFRDITVHNHLNQLQKAKLNNLGLVLLLGGVLSLLIALILENIWVLGVGGVAFIAGLGCFVLKLKYNNTKFTRVLGEFVVPILTLVKEDVRPTYPVKLAFDYSDRLSFTKQVKRPPEYWKQGAGISYYRTRWMQSQMKFRDGVSVLWGLDILIRKTTRTRRSRSGKYKTKTKYKNKLIAAFKVMVPKARYQVNTEGLKNTKIDSNDTHYIIKFRKKTNAPHRDAKLEPGEVLHEIQKVYQCLTPITQNV